MISSHLMIIIIVALAITGSIIKSRSRHTSRLGDISEDPSLKEMQKEITTLKERVAVLERITTDNHRTIALDREIDALN
ncbi:MAG: hypothetical protein ABF461_02665 [Zymomonas mobilis subsp. pomaceae]|uniref:Phage shock protein B n=1 Tax=Zymomonas mobilis subsp. pomaceae (strain ATCC 29192 / DSM 22645 / JCM 10191 / CCUG 17912 / NBRC 13757 / NCIMB 11200 / NRRL B-4491 / Barker I) TaxID=579138 RepID=F8EU44_ZYMMT|nr:hypothetical protein [Zymomonas mobilis]AEI37124.1 hypothetical protein Zymop_0221 [Zymomonas mobilis subsp. pomaceae ATCC 29192]MDX5948495.1 hypothetical protein [Zymomonas mobilis subsp. pomaceae]GEB89440.1 hypothetical protein ZMO02_10770 [Zymomonas mobilis subsp. pomaceae]